MKDLEPDLEQVVDLLRSARLMDSARPPITMGAGTQARISSVFPDPLEVEVSVLPHRMIRLAKWH